MVPGFKLFIDNGDGFLYSNTMTNDFSTISAESNLKDEITVASNEVFEYPGDATIEPDLTDEGENTDDEGKVTESDESMDGDFDSGMASAGFGYDEQYEHNLCDDYSGE